VADYLSSPADSATIFLRHLRFFAGSLHGVDVQAALSLAFGYRGWCVPANVRILPPVFSSSAPADCQCLPASMVLRWLFLVHHQPFLASLTDATCLGASTRQGLPAKPFRRLVLRFTRLCQIPTAAPFFSECVPVLRHHSTFRTDTWLRSTEASEFFPLGESKRRPLGVR